MRRSAWSMRAWLATFTVLTVLPLLLLLTTIFVAEVRREQREARDTALRAARVVAGRLDTLYTESVGLLERLAARPSIRDSNGQTCDALFTVTDFFPQYADLLLFDSAGKLLCAAQPQKEDLAVSAAAREWIAGELRGGRLVPRRAVMRYLQGRWVAAVSVDIGPKRLVLVELPDIEVHDIAASSAVVTIIDREGMVVARTADPQRWTGRNVRDRGVAATALRGGEGLASDVGIDGVSRQYGFTFIPRIGWHVYVGVATVDVMRSVRTTVLRGMLAGAVILLLVALAAILLSTALARPLNALARAASRVSSGAYGTVEVPRGPREMAQLAEAFNAMVKTREAAEKQMAESERSLKGLSDRLLVVQERERARIAREIHDDLGQSLTALKMDMLGILQVSQPSNSPVRDRVLLTLDSIVTAVQRIASELRPSVLDDLGLVAAIESEARLFEERTAIECDLSLPEQLEIDADRAAAIYRILQEALTNVARHSNATRVEVRIRIRNGDLLLDIRDDGCGISPAQISDPSSFGLIGMGERASIMGGTVQVEGVPGRGTILSVCIPLAGGSGSRA